MSLWLEEKYINLLSPNLNRFKRVKHNLYSFRCPICGDSKKNQYRTRGSFYVPAKATQYVMGCFNCGASMLFSNFLKLQNDYLYNEFQLEKFQAIREENQQNESKEEVKKPQQKKIDMSGAICLDTLSEDHPAVKYCLQRQIDRKNLSKLYFVPKFRDFEKKWRKNDVKITDEHPRLIIPFFDKQGNITRLSARAFGKEEPKYIYLKIKEDASRVYGLDTVDKNKLVRVLEGPLDSLFLDNAIAVGSASLIVPELSGYKDYVLIPDNQPRNKEVCLSIRKMVDSGAKVCIWQKDFGKDINQMVLNGHSKDDIMELIETSTFSGTLAKLKFGEWVKVKL